MEEALDVIERLLDGEQLEHFGLHTEGERVVSLEGKKQPSQSAITGDSEPPWIWEKDPKGLWFQFSPMAGIKGRRRESSKTSKADGG